MPVFVGYYAIYKYKIKSKVYDLLLKIYLTASASERAKRRYLEQKERGVESDLAQIERDIIARDEQDFRNRLGQSPL